jgi:tRNA(Ile)-lysidine synthase
LRKKQQQIRIEERLLLPGQRVGIAVSGGADSVALLRLLLDLQPKIGFVPCVIHLNHMLRGRASDADEKFVAKLAKSKGLEFFSRRVDIASLSNKQKANVEEVARRERYRFFEALVREERVDKIAVAHTADDQAETVLAHILRGTGLSGLRGIHPQTGNVFRPLLGVRRAELRTFLKKLKQVWREDATNRDTTRTRARIRKKLLPMLEKNFNAGVVEHLCQLAKLAGEDETYLETQVSDWIRGSLKKSESGVAVNLADLMRSPHALRTRALRAIVAEVKTRGGQLSREHVEAILELAERQESGKQIQLPGGVEVRREREVLRFGAAGRNVKTGKKDGALHFEYQVDLRSGAAELLVVELSTLLRFRVIDWPMEGRETKGIGAMLDRGRLELPLVVRNWRAGDAVRPRGHQKAHKLGRLLNEKSISRWEKEKLPVLTSGGKLAWVRGLPEAVEFAVGPETREAVEITEEPLS